MIYKHARRRSSLSPPVLKLPSITRAVDRTARDGYLRDCLFAWILAKQRVSSCLQRLDGNDTNRVSRLLATEYSFQTSGQMCAPIARRGESAILHTVSQDQASGEQQGHVRLVLDRRTILN